MEQKELTVTNGLYIMRKKYKLVIVITAIMTILSLLASIFLFKTQYESSVTLFVGKDENIKSKYTSSDMASSYVMLNTYMGMLNTKDFIQDSLDKKGIQTDVENVLGNLKVTAIAQNAPILQIKYTGNNKEEALKIVTAISEDFDDKMNDTIVNTYTKVIDSPKVTEININKIFVVAIGFVLGLIISFIASILAYNSKKS